MINKILYRILFSTCRILCKRKNTNTISLNNIYKGHLLFTKDINVEVAMRIFWFNFKNSKNNKEDEEEDEDLNFCSGIGLEYDDWDDDYE